MDTDSNNVLLFRCAGPDFSFTVSPASASVVQGGTVTYTVTLNRGPFFTDPVRFFTAAGPDFLPQGVSSSFSPMPLTGTDTSTTLTVTTNSGVTTPPGTYPFTIMATNGNGGSPVPPGTLIHRLTATLVVTQADFSFTVSPASASVVQGGTITYTVTLKRGPFFTDPVRFFSAAGPDFLPQGVVSDFSPMPLTGTDTSTTLTVTTNYGVTTPTGTYPFTIMATNGNGGSPVPPGTLIHRLTATLVVR